MQVCTQDQDEEGHPIEGEPEVQVQMKPLSVRHSLLQKGNQKGRERETERRQTHSHGKWAGSVRKLAKIRKNSSIRVCKRLDINGHEALKG